MPRSIELLTVCFLLPIPCYFCYDKDKSTGIVEYAMDIAGKTALVTGAGRRLGRFIALSLADRGANVVVHYRNSRERAMAVFQEIFTKGCLSWLSEHDLAEAEKTDNWFADVEKKTGGIDILINSASEYLRIDYESMSAEDLNRSMKIHVQSPLIMIRAMNRSMRRNRQRGAVVNILDSMLANPRHAAYRLGKIALRTLTRDLALEMAQGLRINSVAPGNILPPNLEDHFDSQKTSSNSKANSKSAKIAGTSNPLGIGGSPKDISDAIIYLLQADFVTGMVLHVDGGIHLGSNTYELRTKRQTPY